MKSGDLIVSLFLEKMQKIYHSVWSANRILQIWKKSDLDNIAQKPNEKTAKNEVILPWES